MEPKHTSCSLAARVLTCLLSLAALALVVTDHGVAEEEPWPEVAYVGYGNIHRTGFHEVTDDRPSDEQPALSPDGLTVAYVRSFYGYAPAVHLASEIVRINVDGTGLQRLTNNDLLESWPAWSPDGTQLAFVGDGDLYVMPVGAAGGGVPVQLTTGGLYPENLVWSADGTQLAFNSWPCGDEYGCGNEAELYVVALAGPQVIRLTHNKSYDGDPTWSPDGTQLAFETAAGNAPIHLIAAARGPTTPLVDDEYAGEPSWSPDGALIAYIDHGTLMTIRPDGTGKDTLDGQPQYRSDPVWSRDGRHLIFYANYERCGMGGCAVMEYLYRWDVDARQVEMLLELNEISPFNPIPAMGWTATDDRVAYVTGGRLYTIDISAAPPASARQLTFYAPTNGDPAWSPDGRLIAFSSQRDFDYNIHVIAPDATNRYALTTHPGNDWNPSWSSNNQIAFTSNRDGNWELYVMDANGSGQTNLTHTPTMAENDAAWSPDGAQLAYARQENGNWDLYVMNADGSGVKRLTSHAAADRNPTWSPDGARLAFQTDRDGNDEIYLLTVAGPPGNEANWTRHPDGQREPTWSPDGTQIAFGEVQVSGAIEIGSVVSMSLADTTVRHSIEQYTALHPQPAWRPVVAVLTPRVWAPMVSGGE